MIRIIKIHNHTQRIDLLKLKKTENKIAKNILFFWFFKLFTPFLQRRDFIDYLSHKNKYLIYFYVCVDFSSAIAIVECE